MRKLLAPLLCLLLAASATLFAQNAEVAPGVTLPHSGNVFALAADHQIRQLHSTEVVSNAHAGSNFAKAQVFAGGRSTVEIDKPTSGIAFPASPSAFFVRVGNGDDADKMRGQLTLIRLKPTKDHRVAVELKQNVFGGHRTRNVDEVATIKVDAGEEGVVKLTPQTQLAPGEYGLIFLPKDPMFFADSVYDFAVGGK